jgi:hypothetical protein
VNSRKAIRGWGTFIKCKRRTTFTFLYGALKDALLLPAIQYRLGDIGQVKRFVFRILLHNKGAKVRNKARFSQENTTSFCTEIQPFAAGSRLLATGCWLLATGCWRLAAGSWLLATG